jgi:hypothetical protein
MTTPHHIAGICRDDVEFAGRLPCAHLFQIADLALLPTLAMRS